MTIIKCPICRAKLSDAEGRGLSEELKEHLAAVHGFEGPSGPERTGRLHVPPSDYSEDSMSLREAEGPVRSSWREEQKMWTAPPIKSAEEHRREEMLHQNAPPEERRVERGAAPEGLGVECPVCGAHITAAGEEDLSDDLRDHMADQHDVRSLRAAWLRRTV